MTIKVDLLPTEKKRFGVDPVWIFLVLVIILFTVGFFVYGKSLETQIEAKGQEVHKVEQEINELRGKLPGIAKMKTDNEKLLAQINTIKGLKNDPVRYANLLWEIADILPENVYVGSINIEPSQQLVTMSCTAVEVATSTGTLKPLESIAQTLRAFQNSRYFKDATMSSTSAGTDSKTGAASWSFSLETHYDAEAALKSPDQISPRGVPGKTPGVAPSGAPAPAASAAPKPAPSAAASTAPVPGASAAPGGPKSAPSGAPSASPAARQSGAPNGGASASPVAGPGAVKGGPSGAPAAPGAPGAPMPAPKGPTGAAPASPAAQAAGTSSGK